MLFPNLISNLNGYQHAFGVEGALHGLNKDVNFKMETYQLEENYNNHTVFPQGRLRIKKEKASCRAASLHDLPLLICGSDSTLHLLSFIIFWPATDTTSTTSPKNAFAYSSLRSPLLAATSRHESESPAGGRCVPKERGPGGAGGVFCTQPKSCQ